MDEAYPCSRCRPLISPLLVLHLSTSCALAISAADDKMFMFMLMFMRCAPLSSGV
jgi:hypothetical protein